MMENKKRLIDAGAFGMYIADVQLANRGRKDDFCGFLDDVMDALNDFPEVDAVALPCKIWDIVYIIRECSCYYSDTNKRSIKPTCNKKVFTGYRSRKYHCGYVSPAKFCIKHLAYFGEKVFLTREEAEAALEERRIDG